MNNLVRVILIGITLTLVGCKQCGERRHLFNRHDDDHKPTDTQAQAKFDPNCNCPPIGGQPLNYTKGAGTGYGQPYVITTPPSVTGPIYGPSYPSYPSGPTIPYVPYTPGTNELPQPGGYATPRTLDTGKIVPKSTGQTTGDAK